MQKWNSDIDQAYLIIDQVIEDLKYFRENIVYWFDHWFYMAQKMITTVGGEESKPRTTKCFSAYRENVPSDDINPLSASGALI